jgi:prepilin-type N-terminal cleavage/methylation domain-containing protein
MMILQRSTPAFSLVELIIVMALLAAVLAWSAPILANSFRQRGLDEEATRFLALSEYARTEAISQGVPMVVWFNPQTFRFGVEPKGGFDGDPARSREFPVNPDFEFFLQGAISRGSVLEAMEFQPDGSPTPGSIEQVRLLDRFGSSLSLMRTEDGLGYEIVRELR